MDFGGKRFCARSRFLASTQNVFPEGYHRVVDAVDRVSLHDSEILKNQLRCHGSSTRYSSCSTLEIFQLLHTLIMANPP